MTEDLRARLRQAEAARNRTEQELEAWYRSPTFRYTAPARKLAVFLERAKRAAVSRLRRRMPRGVQRVPRLPPPTVRGPIRFGIERPLQEEVVSSPLVQVEGWVTCDTSPVTRVEIALDGRDCGGARLGLPRPDVAAIVDRPDAHISGFEAVLDLRSLVPERPDATIELSVATLGGDRFSLGSISLNIEWEPTNSVPAADGSPPVSQSSLSTSDIRLLVFAHGLTLGGAQLYLLEMLKQLSRSSDFSATVVAQSDGVLRGPTEALGIPVIIDSAPITSFERYVLWQRKLEGWVRGGGFNAAFANTLTCFPGADLAVNLELPTVWAIHESVQLPAFWRYAYGRAEAVDPAIRLRAKAALSSAAAVLFPADATRELFLSYGDPRRFATWPCALDIEKFEGFRNSTTQAEARRRLDLPVDATVIVCVGTIEPGKAQASLTQAFEPIAREYPGTLLVFVGGHSDQFTDALRKYLRDAGLLDAVRIVPFNTEPELWLRAADALVCPSDVESLPLVVLEAMALSVPVIATRIFGIPEVIEDGRTGYLFDPRDTAAIVTALRRFLASSPGEHENIAAAAAERIYEHHDSRPQGAAMHALLRAIVENPSAVPAAMLRGGARPLPAGQSAHRA